ncbi:MAG: nucleotidyltransferase domain-containing protein [Bacillota bacterium]|nr:nucleotidyltransferase domain-containing protein [Bacillota bacterium]MDW7685189.1 nucleotidyltransferase domain-containing protein [Bacillota bacterium]
MNGEQYSATCVKLREYFQNKERVVLALLFGSFGTADEHRMSDIDVAVLLQHDVPLMDELKLSAELSILLERDDVDLLMLRNAPVHIAHRALATGRIVFERDRLQAANFVESVLNSYRDFGYRLRQIDREFDEKLREEYLDIE